MVFTHIGNGLYTYVSTTDTKVTTGMTANSIAIEIDTGNLYRFTSGAWSLLTSGGGGGGAPTTSSYVTLGTDATLTSERVLTAGTNVTLTDGGAGSTITIGLGTGVTTNTGSQTLTNKTIDTATNTITGITDANITTHTTTKITTSSKSLLNSAIVYNDQTNTFGAFDQVFPSTRLKIKDPTTPANYIFTTSAITADRTITLPLLTGNDTMVTLAFGQTLTNKSIDATTNTLTNIGNSSIASSAAIAYSKLNLTGAILAADIVASAGIPYSKLTLTGNIVNADISASAGILKSKLATLGIVDADVATHTTSKISVISKSLLNTSIVYTDQSNTFGAFDQVFPSTRLKINDSTTPANYIISTSAISADRTITLPLLTGNDTLVTAAFAQTLTNKTIAAGSNTITGIVDANITAHTTTKITTSSKSLLNSAIVYNDQANVFGAFDQTIPSTRLKLSNSGFAATLTVGTLAADVTITLPNTTSTLVISSDSRLSDARTPTTHATSHNTGGSDVVHIDTIGAGTDITTNNVSTTKHGLVPKAPNVVTQFLDGTGAWSTPSGTGGEANTYSNSSIGGIGIILTKTGVDLPFKGIAAASTKIAVANDATNKNVTIDVNQANLAIAYSQLTSVPSALVKTDQSNTFGAFNQIFPSTRLLINDSTTPANYIVATSAIAADRTVTLPLLTGNDTFVMAAFAQTLTNKTLTTPIIASISNSGTITIPTGPDTLVGRATTDTLTNKTLTTPIITSISNSGTITIPTGTRTLVARDTTDTLTNKSIDATTNTFSKVIVAPHVKDIGWIQANGAASVATSNHGMFKTMVDVGTFTASSPLDTTHGWYINWASAATTNSFAGTNSATSFTTRAWNPYFRVKFSVPSTTTSRCYIGLTSYLAPGTTDTLLANGDSGVILGYSVSGTSSANWNIYHNDGSGAMTVDTTSVAKDTAIHAFEMTFDTSVPNCTVTLYGSTGTVLYTNTITTKLPAASTILYCNILTQTTAASATNFRLYNAYLEHTRTQAPL